MKFNPRLPPMSKFISKHKHVLQVTDQTKSLFSNSAVFASSKMGRNILSMICKNQFRVVRTSSELSNTLIQWRQYHYQLRWSYPQKTLLGAVTPDQKLPLSVKTFFVIRRTLLTLKRPRTSKFVHVLIVILMFGRGRHKIL